MMGCPGGRIRCVAIGLVFGLAPVAAATGWAQEPGARSDAPDRVLSDAARISLVTILPGEKVYSLFGHNALRVYDPGRGIDTAYNYGTFDFGNPLVFAAVFAYGALDYRLTRQDFERMVAYYPAEEGRPIIEQQLALDATQRERIFRFLEWNALPENAYYRYDFYYDNCATRIRDVLEGVLGDGLLADTTDPGTTMRQLLDPYLAERTWLHFGMDAGQGLPADADATWRTELFLPDRLAAWAAKARVSDGGEVRGLVSRADTIGWAAAPAAGRPAPLPWPLLVFSAVLALVAWITLLDVRSGRRGRVWLDVPFFSLLGLAGLLIVFLWFVSLHPVTKRNFNLLWALPTNLVLAWTVARADAKPWIVRLLRGTAICALAFVAGWALWPQELPPATLPLAMAIGVRSGGLAFTRRRVADAV